MVFHDSFPILWYAIWLYRMSVYNILTINVCFFGDIYKNNEDLAEIWYSAKSCLDFHCSFVKLSEIFPEVHWIVSH